MKSYWTVTLFNIQETPITLIKLFAFIVILFITFIIGILVKRGVSKAFSLRHASSSANYAVSRLLYFAVILIGLYVALTTLGIDLTGIAVIAGALSVGIGFGLQSVLSNFVSGILILFEKNVTPGDIIQVESGVIGVVVKINIRSTVIETSDKKQTIIPNTEIISKKLTNWSHQKEGVYQVSIPFSVNRDVDKDKVVEAVIQVALNSPFSINDPTPLVNLVKLTEDYQEWELVIWVSQKEKRTQEKSTFNSLIGSFETVLKKEGIILEKISFPETLLL